MAGRDSPHCPHLPPGEGCLTSRDVPEPQGFVSPIILEAGTPQIPCSQCFPTGELIPYSSSPGRGPLPGKEVGTQETQRQLRGCTLFSVYTSELLRLPVAVLFLEPTIHSLPTFPTLKKDIWKNGNKKQTRLKAQVNPI